MHNGGMSEPKPSLQPHHDDLKKVLRVLQDTPSLDREYMAPIEEFQARHRRVNDALKQHGHVVGLVFSDEQYAGDVPYLGGNTNVSIEQTAGVVGPKGFHIAAGLEGGYVAEQLASRAGAIVHKVELLQLADEKYPIRAERLEDVVAMAAGQEVDHIALLTPRQVLPASSEVRCSWIGQALMSASGKIAPRPCRTCAMVPSLLMSTVTRFAVPPLRIKRWTRAPGSGTTMKSAKAPARTQVPDGSI